MIKKLKSILNISVLVMLCAHISMGQSSVSGTIKDGNNQSPLISVSVGVKGVSLGTITDVDGKYSLNAKPQDTLVFSYVGYTTQEIPVGNQTIIDVMLLESASVLDEVVVTAFGITKSKRSIGYAQTEIDGSDLTQAKDVSVASLLYGKASGTSILKPSTGANGSTQISIRGVDGFSGDRQPLIVVDGVPIDNTNLGQAGQFGGIDRGDAFSSINPDDIESINILKGAAAGTLYGERGANGVVVITTKGGQKELKVELNSTYMIDQPAFFQDFFQKEYGQGRRGERPESSSILNQWANWGEALDGSDFEYYDGVVRPYSAAPEGDAKNFYQNGHTLSNNVSVSGGNELITSRFSVSQLDNQGIVQGANYKRNTINSFSTLKADKFSVSIKANYAEENSVNRTNHGDFPSNPGKAFINIPTNISASMLRSTIRNNDVLDRTKSAIPWNDNVFITNPFWGNEINQQRDVKRRLTGFVRAKYNIFDELSIQLRYAVDWIKVDDFNVTEQGAEWQPQGSLFQSTTELNDNTLDVLLDFSKRVGKIGISSNLGGVQNSRSRFTYGIGGQSFIIPEVYHINNLESKFPPTYTPLEWQTNGFFGSLTLDYENYIFIEGSARQEWYSTLTSNPQLGENNALYWSSSITGVVSELVDLPDAVSFLKLRSSFGVAGNGAPDPYQITPVYGIQGLSYTGQFGTVPVGEVANQIYPNPFLKVTRTQALEFGLELGLFKNRINLDATYYKQNTLDNIVDVQVPSFTGYSRAWANVGEIENKGFEITLSGTAVKKKNLTYDISLNVTRNVNTLLSLAEGIESLTGERARRLGYIRSTVGEQVGNIYGNAYLRDDAGNIVFDESGFPLTESDQLLGNFTPDIFGGLSNNISYKNFSLGVLIDYKLGGEILSLSNAAALINGKHIETLQGRDNPFFQIAGEGVTESGLPNTEFVFLDQYYQALGNIAEHNVFDASFIKVRQVIFSYDLPSTLIEKTPFSGIKVGLVGRNLFFLYNGLSELGMDPESVYSTSGSGFEFASLPTQRSFGMNINVKF